MESTIFLIRHAAHRDVGRVLSGRGGDIPLCEEGRGQLPALQERLARERLAMIATSPVRRARETAQALAVDQAAIETADDLAEVDFGDWTGRSFASLDDDPRWHAWNTGRASARAPGGESMREVQERALSCLRNAARRHIGAAIAAVTHCDVIRAVVAGVLGLSLDRILRFEIAPASVTRIKLGGDGERVVTVNEGAP